MTSRITLLKMFKGLGILNRNFLICDCYPGPQKNTIKTVANKIHRIHPSIPPPFLRNHRCALHVTNSLRVRSSPGLAGLMGHTQDIRP